MDAVDSQQEQQKASRGAKTAENMRYGQSISESGMGGKTTESEGTANQGKVLRCLGGLFYQSRKIMLALLGLSFGITSAEKASNDADESRRDQGYGPGSDVGA